jgi:hypothetical protein
MTDPGYYVDIAAVIEVARKVASGDLKRDEADRELARIAEEAK